MRGKSHRCLGRYLITHYMQGTSRHYQKAFLYGCFQPDWNPATYLKGSVRSQWLRGHNYHNARRYIREVSHRLEKKRQLSLWDYYTLGKLIHYTADAFTYAHNETFPTDLRAHRKYETILQAHFLPYLQSAPDKLPTGAVSVIGIINSNHRKYEAQEASIYNDAHYTLTTCCCVLALLLLKPIP